MAPLNLKGNTFDLAAEKAGLPASASGTDYILVECNGAISPQEVKKLREQKVFIEEYVGNETYLCRYTPTDLAALSKNLPFVKNAVVYPSKVKVSPELRELAKKDGSNKQPIGIHLHDDLVGGSQKVLDQITAIVKPTVQAKTDALLIVTIELKYVEQVAAIDGVRSIGLEKPVEFDSTAARQIMHYNEIRVPDWYKNPLATDLPELDGKGQIVTVADSGFDKGIKDHSHPAFMGRVVEVKDVAGVNPNCNDTDGHGTHVAGCAVGDGVYKGSDGSKVPVKGTAPGAGLIVQSLGTTEKGGLGSWSRAVMLREAIAKGSFIHNNSYNIREEPDYDQHAYEIDMVAYKDPQLLVVCAAGNSGRDGLHIGGQAANKNGVTVGASMTTRPNKNDMYDDKSQTPGQPFDMADFSSIGPGKGMDRIKPDIVAPGVAILATASRDETFQKAVIPKSKPPTLQRDKYGPSPDPLFCFGTGTSMAAPLVSGCLAVIREAVIEYGKTKDPNASLIKALLLHGAHDISKGKYHGKDIGTAPNYVQGYGLVDMATTLLPVLHPSDASGIWESTVKIDDITSAVQPAVTSFKVPKRTIYDGQGPNTIIATMVYTDRAGKELQTLLDLLVETRNAENTATLFKAKIVGDNTLQKRVTGVEPGQWIRLTVGGIRLLEDQNFSIVWSFVKT